MRNLLLLALLASLMITSACKKSSTNPSGTNGYGTFTLGDSTYKVYCFSYVGNQVNINVNYPCTGYANGLVIDFVSPNIPPAAGSYPLGSTNPGQASFGITSSYYGFFVSANSGSLIISQPSSGYLNYSTTANLVYADSSNGHLNYSNSLPFSMNITIPN